MKAERRTAAILAAALVLCVISGCLFLLLCGSHNCGHDGCAVCDAAVGLSARDFAAPETSVMTAVSAFVLDAAVYMMTTGTAGDNTPVGLKVKLLS